MPVATTAPTTPVPTTHVPTVYAGNGTVSAAGPGVPWGYGLQLGYSPLNSIFRGVDNIALTSTNGLVVVEANGYLYYYRNATSTGTYLGNFSSSRAIRYNPNDSLFYIIDRDANLGTIDLNSNYTFLQNLDNYFEGRYDSFNTFNNQNPWGFRPYYPNLNNLALNKSTNTFYYLDSSANIISISYPFTDYPQFFSDNGGQGFGGSNGGMTFDSSNNLYLVSSNLCIYKITPGGVVSIFAGTPGVPGFINGTGTSARFSFCSNPNYDCPFLVGDIVIDTLGNFYVSDPSNNAIRKITSAGVVSTFVSGLNSPDSLCISSNNVLYVANYGSRNVVMIQ